MTSRASTHALRRFQTIFLLSASVIPLAAQNPDVPPKFSNLVSEEDYLRMRGDFVSMLRGLPADPTLRDNAISQMKAAASNGTFQALIMAIPSWTFIGPSPIPNGQTQTTANSVSGRVTAIEIDPTNTMKLYVGTAQGGLYRSLDGGATWTPLFDSAQSLAIGALALAPSDHTILYVGTGEANLSADSFAGVGLYRIDNVDTSPVLNGPINPIRNYLDASNMPQSVPVFQGRAIGKILVHPTDPATVFVGLSGGVIGIGGESPFGNTIPPLSLRGLYRSTNATAATASVAFTRIGVSTGGGCFDTPCTGNRNVSDMVFDSNDPNKLVVWLLGGAAAGDGGIYRSINALAAPPTFTQTFITTLTNARAGFVGYTPGAGPSVIYAATGESSVGTTCNSASQGGAIRVSTDGGATWSGKTAGGGGFCDGQCFYNIALDVIPGATPAQDTLWLGGNVRSTNCQRLAAKSTDGAATFTNLDSGLHADTHAIKIDPTNPNIIYHGDDGGIFKTINGGTSWSSLNMSPFSATQFSGIALHPTSPNFTLGGTQDNGSNLLASNGTTWTRVDFGDGGFTAIDQNAANDVSVTMYHTYFNQTNNLIGYARTLSVPCATDAQWSFKGRYGGSVDPTVHCDGTTDTFNGISLTDTVNFYAPLVTGPGSPNTVYFGTDRLYRSINKGDTVSVVSQAPISAGVPISTIAISPQDDNYRIVGQNNGGLFYTSTGSSTLSVLDATGGTGTIPDRYVGRAVFDPNDKNTAYVALGGYFGGTGPAQSHVWKIKSMSTTPVKTSINTGLPDVPVNAFAVDPTNPSNLFAGTDIGIYASLDGGSTWAPYGSGLPVVTTFGMGIPNGSNELRIATHGRGMWQIATPVCSPEALGSGISVTASGFRINRSNGHWLQTLTITNNGGSPSGPVNVALVGLPATATLTNNTSGTACTSPAGLPYVNVSSNLNVGDSTTFNLDFLNPSNASISYTTKVLAGSGTP
jgi:hypothetical protein